MTDLFTPKGDIAEWRMIADRLDTTQPDDVLTYNDLTDILGRDFLADRSPIYRAMRWLEQERHRTLANVPKVGYRVVAANEHETLARHHHKKSRRQMRRVVSRLASADRNQLDAETTARVDALETNARRQADMIGRLDRRLDRMEKAQEQAIEQATDNAERIARLEAAIARIGRA